MWLKRTAYYSPQRGLTSTAGEKVTSTLTIRWNCTLTSWKGKASCHQSLLSRTLLCGVLFVPSRAAKRERKLCQLLEIHKTVTELVFLKHVMQKNKYRFLLVVNTLSSDQFQNICLYSNVLLNGSLALSRCESVTREEKERKGEVAQVVISPMLADDE
jgi:hypothetical protein